MAIGILLIIIAWCSAIRIPEATYKDQKRSDEKAGYTTPPERAMAYRQMCADRRMLQNFYIGASGLILLAIGTAKMKKTS